MFEDELNPLPSFPIAGPALPFGQAMPPPLSPRPAQRPGIDWTRAIGPLATLALAATGHRNAAAGAGRGSMHAEAILREQQERDQAYALQEQQIAARQQQVAAEQEARRQAAIQELITKAAPLLTSAKSKDAYDAGVSLYEGLGARLGMRPHTIRQMVPYRAPDANEILAKAADAFLKNPANKEALDQGTLTGSIMVDLQGDKKPIAVPVLEVLKAGGVQFDPGTGKPIVIPKKATGSGNVQLDDQVFLGEVAKFETDKGRPATPAERGEIAAKVVETMAKKRKEGTASVVVQAPTERPFTRFQRVQVERQIRTDADDILKPVRDMNRQVTVMRAGLEQIGRTGRMDGGTQAIINTFNRIMEPGSVTREAEYMRTTMGQPLFESLSGQWQKLQQGGAGVTPESLGLLVDLAEQIVDQLSSSADTRLDDLRAQAADFQLPTDRIVPKKESYRLKPRAGKAAPQSSPQRDKARQILQQGGYDTSEASIDRFLANPKNQALLGGG